MQCEFSRKHFKYNIIRIMLQLPISAAFLYDQPHTLHTSTVFRSGGNNIDSCSVDTAVTENISELCYIFFNAVKYAGE